MVNNWYFNENNEPAQLTTKDIKIPEGAFDKTKELLAKNKGKELKFKRGVVLGAVATAAFIGGSVAGYFIGAENAYTTDEYLNDYAAADEFEKTFLDKIRDDRAIIQEWENDKTDVNRTKAVQASNDMRNATLELLAQKLGAKRVSYTYDADKVFRIVVFDKDGNRIDYAANDVPDEIASLVDTCEDVDNFQGDYARGDEDRAMRGLAKSSNDLFEGTASLAASSDIYVFDGSRILSGNSSIK